MCRESGVLLRYTEPGALCQLTAGEGSWLLISLTLFLESVTFNESAAGAGLVISESASRMKYSKKAKSLTSPDGSLRFWLPMTLGTKGFTSGRHYWEVQVGLRNDWDIGVALETVDKSDKVLVKTMNGFYSIGKMGFDYRINDSPCKTLNLCPRPRIVGVYLDYEEGRVSFYDVNEKLHIHSFIGESFTGKLFPYFYLYSGKITAYQVSGSNNHN
uniref:B30.2/SPRY domain-containing protein n=1 Tax=Kryptolebias marmoratus TaxID=37003 RepID=A0A3Q3FNG6_KRYMA